MKVLVTYRIDSFLNAYGDFFACCYRFFRAIFELMQTDLQIYKTIFKNIKPYQLKLLSKNQNCSMELGVSICLVISLASNLDGLTIK